MFHLLADPAGRHVVVDDPACLHRRVRSRRADETEACRLQALRQLLRVRRVAVLPHQLLERRSCATQGEYAVRVRDRSLDLAAVPDDARVAEQALDVMLAEARDGVGVEAGERGAE